MSGSADRAVPNGADAVRATAGPGMMGRLLGRAPATGRVGTGYRLVLSQLAGGAVSLLLGAFPVLAGLGLVGTTDPIGLVGRVVAVLFGGFFLLIGGVLVASPFVTAARGQGVVTWRAMLGLGVRRLGPRVTLTSVCAALWMLLLAAACWAGAAGAGLPWLGDAEGLRPVVIIEFLVIHGFPFLVVVAWFARHMPGKARVIPGAVLALLLWLYGVLAWSAADGVWGVVALLYLITPNVLAFTQADAGASMQVMVVSRWAIKFALLVLTAAILGETSFEGPETIWVGAVYFTLLVGVEVFRIVELPGEMAAAGSGDRGMERAGLERGSGGTRDRGIRV
jgi:hypothetical protein